MPRLSEFIVGIVFLVAMSVLGYFTILRGDLLDTRKYYEASVVFTDVEGLELGSKIYVNGVDSGVVKSIDLQEDGTIIVTLRMHKQFTLYENYRIVLKNQSALGGKVIALYPGSAESGTEVYDTVATRRNLHGTTIGDPLTKLSEILDENSENIKVAVRNFREFAEKINSGQGTIAKLVNEDTIHSEGTKLIKELRDTIEDSREQAPVTSFIRAAITMF